MSVVNNSSNYIGGTTLTTIKAAPAITVTGMIFYGYTVQDWACILTIIWVLIQIYLALYSHFKSKPVCPVCKKKH